ncbi:MAG: cyclin-dependent kinase inhibitor 3 family protein [Rhodospirillales bacterium]|nr:cyclin-dependent kinase inhibitor 3 family protein [Rhodospirillales bacterium]
MTIRTSSTDPLQIAEVRASPSHGRIGITFCPGKHDDHALTGAWHRDLAIDLDAISDWGASAVVTLVEQHELVTLRVESLGAEVARQGMTWFHLPIVDGSVPDERFEAEWRSSGSTLHAMLHNGKDIVVHCRGGLGRAGMIGARLLIELGTVPETAIRQVREARRNAIETMEQEEYLLSMTVGRG